MMATTKPAVGSGGQGLGSSLPGRNGLHAHCTPVALTMQKHGRVCVVAKLTYFIGEREPILAVAWRGQRGTKAAISMPAVALEYARRHGVTRFYLRDDRTMRMWTCDLTAFERGKLQPDGERYIPLSWLQPVSWRAWAYAKTIVRLAAPEPVAAEQLALFG